jgi:hypothetical protein
VAEQLVNPDQRKRRDAVQHTDKKEDPLGRSETAP